MSVNMDLNTGQAEKSDPPIAGMYGGEEVTMNVCINSIFILLTGIHLIFHFMFNISSL